MLEVQTTIDFEIGYDRALVVFDEDHKLGGLALQVKPNSLLGALWIQFALAVAGNKKYRACATCRQWFELSPQIARTSKLFCSEACRSQAYRNRKEKAHLLAAEGKTFKQIAEELGSDLKTVQEWLKHRKG
jgi:hypothetical protein